MSENKKKWPKRLFLVLLLFFFLGIILAVWFQAATRISPPTISNTGDTTFVVKHASPGFYSCGPNWLHKSNSGLWELYVEGDPFQRGVMIGKLTKDLIFTQEKAFTQEIGKIVPSPTYLRFLKYFIYWFNRDIDQYITEEYKEEIYGISLSASSKYAYIGSNYQRMLNYHSAHDIGHALQDMKLVGCTALGVWKSMSADSSLLIGRNFDFYAGDEFAENKIVCFEKPSKGYPFMMITWGGMIGAVSGMNDQGLTVTINAAKSRIPYSARTPISILAREILQYAKNLDEAREIAIKRETFVSESIMVGSAEDGKAVIYEKSPYKIGLVSPRKDYIISTNHFQSKTFADDAMNRKDMKENASVYRFKRVTEDLIHERPLDVAGMAKILRDQQGLQGADIGMGNEKAINQLIAHHSVIFEPEKRLVWVSTGPWQIGSYACYDLVKIFHNFAELQNGTEITEADKVLAPDPFLGSAKYKQFQRYGEIRAVIRTAIGSKGKIILPESALQEFIASNAEFFDVYEITGDYYASAGKNNQALSCYHKALKKVIPRQKEKDRVISKLAGCIIQKKKEKG